MDRLASGRRVRVRSLARRLQTAFAAIAGQKRGTAETVPDLR